MRKGKIYCGFSGIGKTTTAANHHRFVDLERTFWDWELNGMSFDEVIDIAITYVLLGRDVALGSDRYVREALNQKGIEYIHVLPHIDDCEIYRKRYSTRDCGNSQEHIDYKCGNWNKLLGDIFDGEEVLTLPSGGYFNDYMNKVYEELDGNGYEIREERVRCTPISQ